MSFFSRIPDKVLRSARSMIYSLHAEDMIYRLRRHGDVVIMYHNVLPKTKQDLNMRNIAVADFHQSLDYLKKKVDVVPLREILTTKSNSARVSITFDDGLVNNLHHALPVLEDLKLHATFFVPTPWINGNNMLWPDELSRILSKVKGDVEFDDRKFTRVYKNQFREVVGGEKLENALLKVHPFSVDGILTKLKNDAGIDLDKDLAPEDEWRVMKGEEIKILSASNYVEIGSHSVSHKYLPLLNDQQLISELVESKRYLEQVCRKDIDMFAFPFGGYSQRVVEACYAAGYNHLIAVDERMEGLTSKNKLCLRVGLYNDSTMVDQLHLINKSFV